MSKNITIKEDGVSQNLSLDVLRIPAYGGGTVDFVPDDNLGLVKIRVKQNGTYKASDFGAYGISEVSVACTVSGGSATSEADSKPVSGKQNVNPTEGGKQYMFSVKRLSTILTAGGICKWIQKAAVALGLKSINLDNKTYKASDDGYYGYSQCTVSGISITRSTDGDGNTVVTHTDGGGTVSIVVPDRIVIDTLPTITNYADGATINFSGMVVKAYKADGTLWTDESHPNGIIPFDELILPVTVADNGSVYDQYYSDGNGLNVLKVGCMTYIETRNYGVTIEQYYDPVSVGYDDEYQANTYFCSSGQSAAYVTQYDGVLYLANIVGSRGNHPLLGWATESTDGDMYILHYGGYWFDNYDVFHFVNNFSDHPSRMQGVPESTVNPENLTVDGLIIEPASQLIPVQWIRPGDYNTLEANYNITVIPSNYAGATGGGGQAGETGAGRND